MSTDIELLPLYAELQGHPKLEIVKHYARANVAHATAAKDAEIERLRALLLEMCDDGDEADADLLATLERTRTAQAEVDRLRRMVQERDNMLGRRPCAGVNADGKPRCFELVDARAEIEALRAEVRELRKRQAGWERHVAAAGCEYVRDGEHDALVNRRAERLAEALRPARLALAWASERLPEMLPQYEAIDAQLRALDGEISPNQDDTREARG